MKTLSIILAGLLTFGTCAIAQDANVKVDRPEKPTITETQRGPRGPMFRGGDQHGPRGPMMNRGRNQGICPRCQQPLPQVCPACKQPVNCPMNGKGPGPRGQRGSR